ncbi:LOW QUALITY PROTEIN: BPI fold-containing family B member 6-like [Cariama cristata]
MRLLPGDFVLNSSSGANLPAVSTALNESDVLQKMAEEAAKKKANTKPIKGILGLIVKDLCPPVISLVLSPGSGLFMAVLVQMTIAGKSTLAHEHVSGQHLQKVLVGLTVLHQREGKEVDLPTDQPSLASLPPKRDATAQLILSANFLSAELSSLQVSFNLEISNNVVAKAPVVTITPDKSFVQLFSTAEFRVSPSDPAPKSLFVLDVFEELKLSWFRVEKMLAMRSSPFLEGGWRSHGISRGKGCWHMERWAVYTTSPFQEPPLKGVLADVIYVAYVPSINRKHGYCFV